MSSEAPIKPPPATGASDPALAEFEKKLASLLAAGKTKQAVESAKDQHKRSNSPRTEQLLVDAYLARIRQFQEKGAIQDAQVLIDLVASRFPAYRGQLQGLQLRSAAAEGRLETLLAPLAQGDVTDELRQTIDTAIRQKVTDPSALAQIRAFPPEHSLRVEAAAIDKVLRAVTTGPVDPTQVALPEISRRSPLASWKMLIRAIAAFYRREDESCRRSLAQVAPDSAVHKLAAVLAETLDEQPAKAGRNARLQEKIGTGTRALRQALIAVDRAIDMEFYEQVAGVCQTALSLCQGQYPDLVERLRQHLFLKLFVSQIPARSLRSAVGTPLMNAYFWRLCAYSAQKSGAYEYVASNWERFATHAIDEGLIIRGSPEEAAVYLAAAKALTCMDTQGLDMARRRGFGTGSTLDKLYDEQSKPVRALKPQGTELAQRILDIDFVFGKVVAVSPDSATFKLWSDWYARQSPPMVRQQEDVARKWRTALPRDVEPLLTLMTLAEQRNALKMATDRLNEAEAIDPMNPQVRRARLRLMLATTWRHFKNGKPALVEKDLAGLGELPAMSEPLHTAFLSAIRVAWHMLRGDLPEANRLADDLVKDAGPQTGMALLVAARNAAGLQAQARYPEPLLPATTPLEVAETEAHIVRLAKELDLEIYRPVSWDSMIETVLRQASCPLPPASIVSLAEAADSRHNQRLTYLATAAGLPLVRGEMAAQLLLYRARALPARASLRRRQCLRAALELARMGHDENLVRRITVEIDRLGSFSPTRDASRSLDPHDLEDILKFERAAEEFPDTVDAANQYLTASESINSREWDPSDASNDLFDVIGTDDEDDEDSLDDEPSLFGPLDNSADAGMPDISSAFHAVLPAFVQKLTARLGHAPTPAELEAATPDLLVEMLSNLSGGSLDRAEIEETVRRFTGKDTAARAPKRRRKRR